MNTLLQRYGFRILTTLFLVSLCSGTFAVTNKSNVSLTETKPKITIHTAKENVEGIDIFYRESGRRNSRSIVLLHGFGSSSYQYRSMLRELGDAYHVIAPDYPGFGKSDFPDSENYAYTFKNLAKTMNAFLEKKKIAKYVLGIQDYGAPIGMHIATAYPERVTGFIVMNGNIYKDGLKKSGWGPVIEYWGNKSIKLEKKIIKNAFSQDALKWGFTHGARQPSKLDNRSWKSAYASIARDGQNKMQLALFYDYQTNVAFYPIWQQHMRKHQVPVLVAWGRHDPYFTLKGAKYLAKDVEDIDLHILDTGHFPLEEEADFIIDRTRVLMSKIKG